MKISKHYPSCILLILFIINANFSFAILSTPSIAYPYNNAVDMPVRFLTSFNAVGATSYILESDISPTFNSKSKFRSTKINFDSYTLDSLGFNQKYYLRIKSFNSGNTDSSNWSSVISFTTIGNPVLYKIESLALIAFSWNKANYTLMEIQIDTTKSFNSSRFATTITTSNQFNFKYTKAQQQYYYRYRYRYGSKVAPWVEGGTALSANGFSLQNNYINDSFSINRNIQLVTNYEGDTNVIYYFQIDTVNTFNSSNLFKQKTSSKSINFIAKPQTTYYMRIVMIYPNNVWDDKVIYKFSTAKNTPPYSLWLATGTGTYLFVVPPGYTKVAIEMDTSLKFNSALKTRFDTSFSIYQFDQNFTKKFNNIKQYHKMYMRYNVATPENELGWYCSNKYFLIPGISMNTKYLAPISRIYYTTFNDQKGIIYEIDTSLKFNSNQKIKRYASPNDSIRTLKFGRNYYIHIKSFNAGKDTTDWSAPVLFNTLDTTTIYFTDKTYYNFDAQGIIFRAEKQAGVKLFQWQLDTNSNFSKPYNYYSGYELRLTDNLPIDKIYFWRMRMISTVDTSKWSTVKSFRLTINYYLPFPFLIYPPNNSKNINPNNLQFIWKDNTGGLSSNHQFSLKEAGSDEIFASISKQSLTLKKLKPNKTYTWYVTPYHYNHYSLPENLALKFTFTTAGISSNTDIDFKNNISIYPNPANSDIAIELYNGEIIENVSILNINGQLIYEQADSQTKKIELDISTYAKGIYIVSCRSSDGVYVSKFIKE